MAELGIDISSHKSRSINEIQDVMFDYVVTVCDNAKESCPVSCRAGKHIHHSFDDPSRLVQTARTEAEAFKAYRRVRNEIKAFVENIPRAITTLCRNLVADVWSTRYMERLGWRCPQANKLAAMRKTGHGWPVCSHTTIMPCA